MTYIDIIGIVSCIEMNQIKPITKFKTGKISLTTSIFHRIAHEKPITNKCGKEKSRKTGQGRTNRNDKLKDNEMMIINCRKTYL